MAANHEEPNMDYAPMEDPNPQHNNRGFGRRVTKVLLVASGLFALAALAFMMSSNAPDPDAISIQTISKHPPPLTTVKEVKASTSDISRVTTIRDFNQLIAKSIVTDHKSMFHAIPTWQWEALFNSFLSTIGTSAPDSSGFVPEPRKSYSTDIEHKQRFAQFQKNMLEILQLNAEEYMRNPSSKRARFGITVHADWTKEEFRTTRLNLKATDIPKYLSEYNLTVPKAASKKRTKAAKASKPKFSNYTTPRGLRKGADTDHCRKDTGGTCWVFPCNHDRGAVCYEKHCVCMDGSCAKHGKCKRPGNCLVATGGSCRIFGCDSSRNARCKGGDCVCGPDSCAVGGRCVLAEDRNGGSDTDLHCSTIYSGAVRNQGLCGDCWAVTTAQQLRYMTYAKYDQDPGLMSVQYLVDCIPEAQGKSCSWGVKGCCGGLSYEAHKWLATSGGIPTKADYGPLRSDKHPHKAYRCKSNKPKTVTPSSTISFYDTEKDIANALCDKGPVAIAIAAASLAHYHSGIFTSHACPADSIDHAVLYVGVDKTWDHGKPVHIILNSWGKTWGVNIKRPYQNDGQGGHVLFRYGENVCNIEALASQPKDVEMK